MKRPCTRNWRTTSTRPKERLAYKPTSPRKRVPKQDTKNKLRDALVVL